MCARTGRGSTPVTESLKPIARPRPRVIHTYVWCDLHCEIHGRKRDFYDEGVDFCAEDNWRTVYVSSDDPLEFADI